MISAALYNKHAHSDDQVLSVLKSLHGLSLSEEAFATLSQTIQDSNPSSAAELFALAGEALTECAPSEEQAYQNCEALFDQLVEAKLLSSGEVVCAAEETQSKKSKKKRTTKVEDRAAAKLEKKMEEFHSHKSYVPPPVVIHDKPDPFKNDILLNNVSLIIGGKTLLD